MRFVFGAFALDAGRRELSRAGVPVAIEPQVFDLLLHLVRHRDRMVSKEDLLDAVWGGRIVSESSLTSRVNAARKAVGDSGEEQRLIRTVPRKGFRFVAEVVEEGAATASHPSSRYGGYGKGEFAYIEGRYFCYRRSFLTGKKITRSVLDIRWNDALGALSFDERLRYVSDGGVEQITHYAGEIHMHLDRVLMTLLSIDEGEVRAAMVNVPEKRATSSGTRKLRGVLLTHGYPKSFYQPVISAVAIELASPEHSDVQGETMEPGHPDFERVERDLRLAEEHAVVMTPLLARLP